MPQVQDMLDPRKEPRWHPGRGVLRVDRAVQYKDARRRIDDPILVATSVATSMLPIIGVFVYMCCARRSTWQTCASASSRSARWSASSVGRSVPVLQEPHRGRLPQLPRVHDQASPIVRRCERPLDPRSASARSARPRCRASHRRRRAAASRSAREPRSAPRPTSKPKAPARRAHRARRHDAHAQVATGHARPARGGLIETVQTDSDVGDIRTEPFQRFQRGATPADVVGSQR